MKNLENRVKCSVKSTNLYSRLIFEYTYKNYIAVLNTKNWYVNVKKKKKKFS